MYSFLRINLVIIIHKLPHHYDLWKSSITEVYFCIKKTIRLGILCIGLIRSNLLRELDTFLRFFIDTYNFFDDA